MQTQRKPIPALPGYDVEFIPLERRLSGRRQADYKAANTPHLGLLVTSERRRHERRETTRR